MFTLFFAGSDFAPRRMVAGEPLHIAYDVRRRILVFEFRHDPAVAAPTEIFLPRWAHPRGVDVEVSDGSWEIDEAGECLRYQPASPGGRHRIVVRPRQNR